MRKTISFLSVLALLLFFSACGNKENFQLNLEPSFDYYLNTKIHFEGSQTLMGQEQVTNSDLIQKIKLNILDKKGAQYRAAMTFPEIALQVNLNVGVLKIDGNKPNENPISHVFQAMGNHEVILYIEEDGEVRLENSMDQYFDKILNEIQIQGLGLEEKLELKGQLLEQFDDQFIISQLERYTKIPSNKNVAVGSKWKHEFMYASSVGGTLKNQYHIVDETATAWIIEIEGDLSPNRKADPIIVHGFETTFKMNGELKGTIHIDKYTAWPVSAELNENYEGDLLMKINNKETKVPAKMMSKTIIEEHQDKAIEEAIEQMEEEIEE